ncbi:hypothetical protein N7444_000055 [Penicillium canescens]|nr:hypothetical protein N7444_000055 [Penicillium canescens]
MESPRIFPFVRPWRNSTKQKSNKRCSLPPPPELGCSLFHNHVQKDIGLMNLTRGSNISESSENVKDKENKGIRLQEMLIKMEESLGLALTSGAKEKSIQYPPSAGPVESARMSPTNRHQGTVSSISIPKQTSPEPSTQTWTVFPRESRRTIIAVDTAVSSDDEESDLWPLPDNQPSTVPRFSAALPRFFPELSFTDFVSVSSIGASAAAHQQSTGLIGFSSNFETELRERVQTLYKDSANAVDILATDVNKALKQKTATSVPGSGDLFDCVSSCYSSRTSIASVETECFTPATKEPHRYSILSPVAAGVFDDAVSACSLRAPTFVPPGPTESTSSKGYASGSTYPSCSMSPSRRASIFSKLSFNDIKNKPLPLEPGEEPGPLAMHRNHYAPYLQQRQSLSGGRIERSEASNGQRLRHILTLAQAAVELEYGLADLTRDPHIQRRTLLVLDGPLQISRHSGDLVATRPAPAPPSTNPHSKMHPLFKSKSIHRTVKTADDAMNPQSCTLKSFRATRRSCHLPSSTRIPKPNARTRRRHIKLPNPETSKLKDEAERRSRHSNANSNTTDKFSKTSRTDKPFTMAMRFFRRRNNTRAPNLEEPRLSVVLGLRPETSQPNPHAHIPAEAHLDRRPRVSHSNPNLDLKSDLDLDAGTPSKGHDLRLHLPRSRTQDLGFGNAIGLLSIKEDLPIQNNPSPCQGSSPRSASSAPHRNITIPTPRRRLPRQVAKANQRLRHTQACLDCAAEYYPASSRAYLRAPSNAALTAIIVVSMFMERTHIPVDLLVRLLDRLIMPIMAHIDSIDSLDDLFNFVLSISAFTKFSSVTI